MFKRVLQTIKRQWSLRTKLIAGFLLVGAMAVLASAVGYWALQRAQAALNEMDRVFLRKQSLAAEIRQAVDARLISIRTLGLLEDSAQMRAEAERGKAAYKAYRDLTAQLRELTQAEEQVKLLDSLDLQGKRLDRLAGEIESFMQLPDQQRALEVLRKDLPKPEKIVRTALDELTAITAREAAASRESAAHALSRSVLTMIAVAALALLIGVGVAYVVARAIRRGLGQAIEVADAVAAGDLARQIKVQGDDEIAQLVSALARMQMALRALVADVTQSVQSIDVASDEIARGNQDLSDRTEQQAANLQQTAASMEELTGAVRNSADNAQQATQLARTASNVAAKGGDVVGRVVHTMDEIQSSAQRIADIIAVIDGIAFQTNILALNASVEAARAGEQGRGFAVVAGEVRNLAQRSAQAAREIKVLIGDSVSRVDAGTKLVAEAGTTMDEIVAQVHGMADLINNISATASEQSGGLGQVNAAVSQLDNMTQQNAALVEEAAAAAASLREQAEKLTVSVRSFKLH